MQIISNYEKLTHRQVLIRLIEQSEEIIICVAFLKMSGLTFMLEKLKDKVGKCTFYIGIDYYLTEPNAIRKLSHQGHIVFKTQKARTTFHPKIYYFRKGNSISLLTGSANLTGGGLETNFEISLLSETQVASTLDEDFKEMIKLFDESSIDFSNELLISQYESDYDRYTQKHKRADKEFKEELKNIYKFDFSKLSQYIAEYKADKTVVDRFQVRVDQYKNAKRLLNESTRVSISSQKEFLNYYDRIATSFHSSGLLRGKKTLAKKFKTILSIFKLVQENRNINPKLLFSKALPLVKEVDRYGINALTELMNTYNPKKYSVANGRTLKSLAQLNFPKFPSPNDFDAETYERYNNLIIAIAKTSQLENLGHVDHFLSWCYEKYVKNK